MYDNSISPVGWYICSYLIRFVEVNDPKNNDENARFLSWENTVLIKAQSSAQAYEKTVQIAQKSEKPYLGGDKSIEVQWIFEGITEVLPIYEPLEDGAEIMWCERSPRKLKNLKALILSEKDFIKIRQSDQH